MPPIRYVNPKPIFVKVPVSPIYPQKEPEVRIGQTLVAAGPRSLRTKHYEHIKRFLEKSYGKRQQNIIGFYPTRALCRRLEETKLGGGKGDIRDFIARIPAGKTLVHLPNIVAYQNFDIQHTTKALTHLAGTLPNRCIIRSQYNHFEELSLKKQQEEKRGFERRQLFKAYKARLNRKR